MEKLTINQAQSLNVISPFALICAKGDERTNVTAVSWWTYVSNNPATLVVALGKKSCSLQNIKMNKEFALCVVNENLQDEAFKCGITTGHKIDKVKDYNIEMKNASSIQGDVITESCLIIECKVSDVVNVHDHDLVIAEIVYIQGKNSNNRLYAVNGYSNLFAVNTKDVLQDNQI